MKSCTPAFGIDEPTSVGNAMSADAKMIGMTPAMFTRIGR